MGICLRGRPPCFACISGGRGWVGVRTLPVFLIFKCYSWGGMPAIFGWVFSLVFFVLRKNAHTPGHLPSFCEFRGHLCGCLCTFCCLFLVRWRPRHFACTLLTQFGAFFLRLGAQLDETRQPRHPQCAFWPHPGFRFCDFAETVLPCRRQYLFASLGGARPSLFHMGRL